MVIGHRRILDFLKKSVENNRLAHAYLFVGPANLGKRTVALEFIRMLNGDEIDKNIHPDILIVEPEISEKKGVKKELEIKIEEIRKVQHRLSLSSYNNKHKIALIDQAEKMTGEASNCLLKTLEEPSAKSILILISSSPQLLLETIVSRCQAIKFLPAAEKEIADGISVILSGAKNPAENSDSGIPRDSSFCQGGTQNDIRQIIRLANGRPGLAINYLENPELIKTEEKIISQLEKIVKAGLNEKYKLAEDLSKDIPQARWILNQWLFWFRDLILTVSGCPELAIYPSSSQCRNYYSLPKLINIIKAIKKTDWLLSNASINSRLALEVLMLEI
jgi:DNA polymerase-3 subunit delta'